MKTCSFVLYLLFSHVLIAQEPHVYWQQEVDYNIDVSLDDADHTLHGFETLTYTNRSPDTLYFIWFHLWPNAYKNENTAFAKQLSRNSAGRKILRNKRDMGSIDSLDFFVNNAKALTSPDPENPDLIKVFLPRALLPGQQASISTTFRVTLPTYISRSGHIGNTYMICQWYPKPAVYDRKGWHPLPYLEMGEYYSEFGKFNVAITIPSDYVVAATGTLQNEDELSAYRALGTENFKAAKKKKYKPNGSRLLKTLRYSIENVHDFAWFADKNFIIEYDSMQLVSGKIIDVFAYHSYFVNRSWDRGVNYIKDAVRNYSNWVGEYPYPVVQAVEGPYNEGSGGMEYPTITLITSPAAGVERFDAVIAHEVGHNWFYGILGTNERDHAWMDEGINSYYQFRYEAEKYRGNSIVGFDAPADIKRFSVSDFQAFIYDVFSRNISMPKPIETTSSSFTHMQEYATVEYLKAASWMHMIETKFGRSRLDDAMRHYFDQWKFKHPYPEDLQSALQESLHENLDDIFSLLNKEGALE